MARTEDAFLDEFEDWLKNKKGLTIRQRMRGNKRGIDIIATDGHYQWYFEGKGEKGEGTSKQNIIERWEKLLREIIERMDTPNVRYGMVIPPEMLKHAKKIDKYFWHRTKLKVFVVYNKNKVAELTWEDFKARRDLNS